MTRELPMFEPPGAGHDPAELRFGGEIPGDEAGALLAQIRGCACPDIADDRDDVVAPG